MKVAIIGAGWYGCHVALELKKKGYEIALFEKNSAIMSGISGNFGIRLHRGPHYPRSKKTREICAKNFARFVNLYPELVVELEQAYYALGIKDAHKNPPKVSATDFEAVCHEVSDCQTLQPENTSYTAIQSIYDLKEPSIAIDTKLRVFFEKKLLQAHIPLHLNTNVTDVEDTENGVQIRTSKGTNRYDYAINATSFKDCLSLEQNFTLPVDLQISYQVCLALIYKDKKKQSKPFSFIVMDGWFPCLMPTIKDDTYDNTYILTHGCFTIMASCQTPAHAQVLLDSYTDNFINKGVRIPCEDDMLRYIPDFLERFEYIGWKGAVLAKPKTKSEFRSALTFAKGHVIHIIPGKVSNVINAGDESLQIIENRNCKRCGVVTYVQNGILDRARQEIEDHPSPSDVNTVNLNVVDTAQAYSPTFFNVKETIIDKKPERIKAQKI